MSDHPDIDPAMPAARCPFLSQLEQLPRLTEARYADALGELHRGADPADVAARLFDQDCDIPNAQGVSALFTTWGQFIDHDLSLTPEGEAEIMQNAAFPHGVGRSEVMPGSGTNGPREFGNAITWQIDASMVYGSNEGRVADVRAFEGGRLATTDDPASTHGLLPQATPDVVMAGDTEGEDAVFLAGDVRANENPNLLTLHTLFVREHNYWAERLAEAHPDWTDDQLFSGAREIVEYQIQKITYEEWLPLLVGGATPADIDTVVHDSEADGQIALEFSTAAFRFGHTLVASQLERVEDDGTVSEAGHQGLMDAFFDPGGVREGGLDDYLRGMAQQSAQDLDTKVVDALNFFLATPDGVSGFSLPALNLLRSADHGMDSYVNVRAQLLGDIDPAALDPSNFSIITADTDLQAELASVYGTVHDVDLWVGGLAEDQVEGTMLGPLFGHIVSDQFVRTATADETFGTLDPALGLQIIADARASDLQHIILRNTNIDHLQDNPFLMETRSLTEVMTIQGSPQNDAVDIAALEVETTVITRSGDDSVIVTSGSRLQDGVNLGGGDDRFEMSSGSVDGGVSGGSGADAVGLDGTARADQLRGGAGNDTIRLDEVAAAQAIKGQAGHDAIHLMGKAAAGAITGNAGDDRIELSDTASASVIRGGRGDDNVWVADGAHAGDIHLGTGDDLARLDGPGTHQVDGGKGTDVLQVGAGAKVMFDGDTDGTITWADGDKTTFRNFEVVTCFTPGTLIVTAAGKRPIETLKSGARVLTLDHGLQPIRWVGRTKVPAQGRLAPIRIDAQALGNTRRLDVSPQHRMLLTSAHAEMLFGATDMLAPALALIDRDGVARCEGGEVDYIHLLFDRHEIIFAEGIPSESFHPGLVALSALDRAARDEIQRLFPDLPRDGYGADARPALRGREARLLARLLA